MGCPTLQLLAQPHDAGPLAKKPHLLDPYCREVTALEVSKVEDLLNLAKLLESQTIKLAACRLVYASATGKLNYSDPLQERPPQLA